MNVDELKITVVGTAYEDVNLVVNGGGRTLYQGKQTLSGSGAAWEVSTTGAADFIVPVGGFPENTSITFTVSYVNVTGSYTETFMYDSVVDPLILTTPLTENMYILAGISEARASGVSVTINGEAVPRKSIVRDVYGSFTVNMPLVLEGDEVYITITDLANNVSRFGPYIVGADSKDTKFDAYAMGKVYTNAHGLGHDEEADWTTGTYLEAAELAAGVDLPMVAANAFVCGTTHLELVDNKVVATVSFDEDVESESIYVGVQSVKNSGEQPDLEGFIAQSITDEIAEAGEGYWICVASKVSLPASVTKSSFQLENNGDNEVRALYMNRQRRQPLSMLEEE